MFTRTSSGISNQALFYAVDLIVYTEGGSNSFTVDEVESGKCNEQSPDIRFWRSILSKLDRRIKIKAVGCKKTCLLICEKVINKEITNVAIAIDRDIDERIGSLLDSPYILYTKGYSWENDVFTRELTCEQVESLLLVDSLPDEIISIIDDSYSKFRRIGKNLAKLEIIFRTNGIRFISDVSSERFFDSKKKPYLEKEQIFVFLKEKKKKVKRPAIYRCCLKNIDPYFDNYGKLIQAISITVIRYICRKFRNLTSCPNDVMIASMLDKFGNKLQYQGDSYYDTIVERLRIELN